MNPTISTDGKKLAYFTNENIYSSLVVANLNDKKIKKIIYNFKKNLKFGLNRIYFICR